MSTSNLPPLASPLEGCATSSAGQRTALGVDQPTPTPAHLPTIYLSGPMSGLPEYNYPAFARAAAALRANGFSVVSPHEIPAELTTSWTKAMSVCIDWLFGCTHIAMLPGWENSVGATIERTIALELGLSVFNI